MQISMFNDELIFPKSHEDVLNMWKRHIFEGEKDADAFTYNKVKEGYSYSFYNLKAFELDILEDGKVKLKLPDDIMKELHPQNKEYKEGQFYTVSMLSPDEMQKLVILLRERKRVTFRQTVTYTFACCNSFVQCSDAKRCLHEDDRDYNGCHYRKNLEAGRIFYGKNKNIE